MSLTSKQRQELADEVFAALHELKMDFPTLSREYANGVSFAVRVVLGHGQPWDPRKIGSEAPTLSVAIEAVRALHPRRVWPDVEECGCCLTPWPCPTIRALDGAS